MRITNRDIRTFVAPTLISYRDWVQAQSSVTLTVDIANDSLLDSLIDTITRSPVTCTDESIYLHAVSKLDIQNPPEFKTLSSEEKLIFRILRFQIMAIVGTKIDSIGV